VPLRSRPRQHAVKRIDTHLRGRLTHRRTPAFSVVVVDGDQVVLSRGYGLADRAAGTPMTEDTSVAIASTSKGMTAVAIMHSSSRVSWT
jgi:CubicO group peptidase (beta-lactamase class C family)